MRNYQQRSTAAIMSSLSSHHTSGSPNSSEEIESRHGTPETKLTAFSPEDVRLQPRVGEYKIVRSNLPPPFALEQPQGHVGSTVGAGNNVAFGSQDPFVTNASTAYRTYSPRPPPRLSPGASSFTPSGPREHGCSPGLKYIWESGAANPQYQSTLPKLDDPPRTSNYDTPTNDGNAEELHVPTMPKSPKLHPVSMSPSTALKIEVVPVKIGYFSSDGETSRSLVIGDVSPRTSPKEVDEFFSVCKLELN